MKEIKNFKVKWFSKDLGMSDFEIVSAKNESEAFEKVKKHRSITFDANNDDWSIHETIMPITF